MRQLKESRVLITGGDSMIGRAVANLLTELDAVPIPIKHGILCTENSDTVDLLKGFDADFVLKWHKPDYVIHCAGYNGNISFNKKYPADIYYRTAQMALNVLSACADHGIEKVVSPLASCAYPNDAFLNEKNFYDGKPDDTVEAHGLSKRIILDYSRQLFKQRHLMSVCTVFNTCYGPYDSFDLEKTKVASAFIKRFVEARDAGDKEVVCWGTGSPRRELIYCDDAAKAIVNVLLHYENPVLPINIGTQQDVSIKELAELVAEIVGYCGTIVWDVSKPDGQMSKLLSTTTAELYYPEVLPKDFTSLKDGLTKTIKWYENSKRTSTV
jgi:GDP-L-fucose synthase